VFDADGREFDRSRATAQRVRPIAAGRHLYRSVRERCSGLPPADDQCRRPPRGRHCQVAEE
jgi:hypothetical protein